MSKRREAGEQVWLAPNAGFVGESNRLRATIQSEDDPDGYPCMRDCGDPLCREWLTLLTEPDAGGVQYPLFHVSECQLFDEPQESA